MSICVKDVNSGQIKLPQKTKIYPKNCTQAYKNEFNESILHRHIAKNQTIEINVAKVWIQVRFSLAWSATNTSYKILETKVMTPELKIEIYQW